MRSYSQTSQQLKDYLLQLEEAKKRDHRKLGKELEIFMFDDEVVPFTLPTALMIEERNQIMEDVCASKHLI
jgi:threonyl-tRNA synthetase